MGTLLRYPGFRSLWLGQLFSQLGNAVFLVMGLWEIQLRSPFLLSIAGLAMVVPQLLAAAGGVFVDRHDPGRLMLYTDMVRGVAVAAGLAALLLPGALVPALIALIGVNSLGAALFGPAESTVLPRLVGAGDLTAANGTYNLTAQIASAVGSALGGAAIAAIGVAWVFGFDMASFWVSALAILAMLRTVQPRRAAAEQRPERASPHAGMLASMREGYEALRGLPVVITLLPIILVANFAFIAGFTLLPYWIHHVLRATAAAYGLIDAGWGAGLVIGSIGAGYLGRMSFRAAGSLPFGGQALLMAVFAFVQSPVAAGVVLLLAGITNGIGNAVVFTLMQRLIPQEVRGRAFGLLFTLFGLANPLGAFAAGVFLHVLPLYWPWLLTAVATGAGALGIWRLAPRGLAVDEEAALPAD